MKTIVPHEVLVSMHPFVTVAAGTVFVLFSGFNVWVMLVKNSPPNQRFWTYIHRAVGYAFLMVLVVMSYFMFLRLKGFPDEPSPRVLVHMSLALLLVPLLAAKILVARYQKGSRTLLAVLGIAIFAISFALVTLNIAFYLLRRASTEKMSPLFSGAVAVIVLGICGALFLRRSSGVLSLPPETTKRNSISPRKNVLLTLSRIQRQTHDSKTLRFTVPQAQRFSARPGQFMTFEWIIDGKPAFRSYSICSSPTQTGHIDITPKSVANGYVSVFLNKLAVPGMTVKAHGPYGQFCFDELKHKRIVLLAGGSGITPMMAMLRYIDDLCIPVDATLVYSVRSQQEVIFEAELSDLQQRIQTLRYILILSRPDADWSGLKGHLNREILERELNHLEHSTFFLCGPPPFMENAKRLLKDLGVHPSAILQESFGSPPITIPVSTIDEPVHAEFVRSGKMFQLSSDQTILEDAELNGLSIPYGCRQGSCGTCATRLLSGKVYMEREDGLAERLKTQGYVLPCVSHALECIKLDA
jgi:ferredoxin-NADP reductase